jgi:hypothetical protein
MNSSHLSRPRGGASVMRNGVDTRYAEGRCWLGTDLTSHPE